MIHILLTLILSLFMFSNPAVEDVCSCSLKYVWLERDTEVGLKESPTGKVIKTLKNDRKKEYVVQFEVLGNQGDWLKVRTIGQGEGVTGWILSAYTAAHTTNYSGVPYQVYQQPAADAKLSDVIRKESKVTILQCCGEWTKIRYDFDGEVSEGYIKTNLLCGNFSSTCG